MVIELDECLDWGEERCQEEQEGGQFADGYLAPKRHPTADQQDYGLCGDPDRLSPRPEQGLGPSRIQVGLQVVVDNPLVASHVVVSSVEGGDHPYPRQAFRQVGQHVGDPITHPQVADE